MSKRTIIGLLSSGVILLGLIANGTHSTQSNNPDLSKTLSTTNPTKLAARTPPKAKPICDGIHVTSDCTLDSISYITYIYHPAVLEKSHVETSTTYDKKITGYCTLCNDGTYSPSCATGRGACSHHGGVQEWNAPEYSNVPVQNNKTVIDSPAQAAYYEKVAE